ncbi:thioredoxin reductase-like protein 1 [Colletotrichum truncatum]|uniref:Thioredoxin reductase-like protein 1 n=1 Tax=Colletotrichum truncatum TaxID=5467 RepID=A0ACC3YDE3_COLTU|nr:thioredoxin reductase-like protein 1 [Colletotrichum truncatum]KAF6784828.1 thioredoxin reductase-like protein 1 [Colletotrichum truncatum]
MDPKVYDILCIGGGPGGLGVAMTVSRQDFSVLVLDSGVYRNARSKHMHMVAGFDHVDPAAFLQKTRGDLQERYENFEFKSATVKTVRKLESGIFEAEDEQGVIYQSKRLVLATGVKDVMEDIPGYEQAWAYGIFHCLFCHGYEERGASSSGVLAIGHAADPDVVERIAKMAKRLSKSVTVYTNGDSELSTQSEAQLNSSKIRFDNRKIAKLAPVGSGPEVDVIFDDGSSQREGFLSHLPRYEQRSSLAAQLGLEMEESGVIKVEPPFNKTSLPGCMAVGDAATPFQGVLQSLYMAAGSGSGVAAYLQDELDAADEL